MSRKCRNAICHPIKGRFTLGIEAIGVDDDPVAGGVVGKVTTIDEHQLGPPIAVEIDDRHATSHCFREQFFAAGAIITFEPDAPGRCHIGECHGRVCQFRRWFEIDAWRLHGCFVNRPSGTWGQQRTSEQNSPHRRSPKTSDPKASSEYHSDDGISVRPMLTAWTTGGFGAAITGHGCNSASISIGRGNSAPAG